MGPRHKILKYFWEFACRGYRFSASNDIKIIIINFVFEYFIGGSDINDNDSYEYQKVLH